MFTCECVTGLRNIAENGSVACSTAVAIGLGTRSTENSRPQNKDQLKPTLFIGSD
jgi:hypothetical protein